MGYVVSWYSRVVDVRSLAFDEGRWCRSSRGDTVGCLMLVSWGRLSRWVQLDSRRGQLKSVESLGTAGQSSRTGSVESLSSARCLMLVSWGRLSRWVQLDSRRGQLRSVESLGTAGESSRGAEVGRVVGYSWTVVADRVGRVVELS